MKKLTTEGFIEKAKYVHGDKYDYSMSKYTNSREKVKIICPKHGIFEQIASNHFSGKGCKKCSIDLSKERYTYTTKDFIEIAINIHGSKYDYSLVKYENSNIKFKIIC